MRLLTLGCWSFGLINVFGIPLGDAQGIEFARRDEGNANANTGIAPQVWVRGYAIMCADTTILTYLPIFFS